MVSILHRATNSATITSCAAEDAIQKTMVRRARKREGQVHAGRAARLVTPWLARVGVFVGFVALIATCMIFFRPRPPVPLQEFTAKVLVGDTVPVGAYVVLHPQNQTLPGEVLPQGGVREDGSVKFVTYPPEFGVPAGDYVVTIQWFRVGPDGSVGGNALASCYASPDKSPLSVTVSSKPDNQLLRISKY